MFNYKSIITLLKQINKLGIIITKQISKNTTHDLVPYINQGHIYLYL